MGTSVSISGSGSANVHIYGNGTVIAGSGNETIKIDGNGAVTVGAGNDQITLHGSGSIFESGAGGHDTINLGHGHDTITEAGHATVYGSFGSATIQGATVEFLHQGGSADEHHSKHHHDRNDHDSKDHDRHGRTDQGSGHPFYEAQVLSGNATLVGGTHCTEFVGGTGSVVMQGGTGNDTFIGGSGHTTMTGGSGKNLFEFTSGGKGGTDVITNFASGHDKLYLEGQSLCYLQSHGDVTVSNGNTFISLDGGKTVVELKGFTNLSGHDVTTHKG
jgi:Ca2+-binding RTX toxin-like protein